MVHPYDMTSSPLPPSAGSVVQSYASFVLEVARVLPGAWASMEGGALTAFSGMPVAMLNGVWGASPTTDAHVIDTLLEPFAERGVPFSLQLRPGCEQFDGIVTARRMRFVDEVPLMLLDDLAPAGDVVDCGLQWHRVQVDEGDDYVDLLARGFEAPREAFALFALPGFLGHAAVSCFTGTLDGSPLTTALCLVDRNAAGLFNVATVPEHRGKGYASAATQHCLRAAHQAGAQWAYLQSSVPGYGVYERLGFRTVERWRRFVSS